jgi:NAD+ kinase
VSRRSAVVVGDGSATETAVIEALAEANIERIEPDETRGGAVEVTSADLAAVDAVFTVGDDGLLPLVAWDCDPFPPVFPIGDDDPYRIPPAAVEEAVEAVDSGAFETVAHPVLDVSVAGDPAGSAITDVTLLTAEPARISEYAVGSPDEWIDTVRADGVVTATPVGSTGYARAAGGPLLSPGTGVVAVPISPYAMDAESWVLRPPVSLSVERDEAAVSLLLDDAVVRQVPPAARVDVRVGREIPIVRSGTLGEE